jgi:hypothetical protein
MTIGPAYMLQLDMTLKADSTGGILFDRYSETDFKYAALSLSTGQIVIGHYTEHKGWIVDAFETKPLDSSTDYQLGVTLQGNVVKVTLNGEEALTHVFNALVMDGAYGLLSANGSTSYDTLTISTNDPAYSQTEPIDSPPTVVITNPINGAVVKGSNISITANALDDMGVRQVEFFLGGTSIGLDTNAGDGWSIIWDTTTVADGDYSLRTVATDTVGQTGSASITVSVDNVPTDNPPTVTITSPANGDTVKGSINITANAADDMGLLQVEFFINGISIGVDSDSADGWSITWESAGVDDGDYILMAVATDTAGQTSSASIRVTVDNVAEDNPPTVAIISPVNGAVVSGETVVITANAFDDVGVFAVEFFVNGISIGVDTNGADGWSAIWNITGIANGTYTLTAVAYDTSGQRGESSGVNVTVGAALKMHVGSLTATTSLAKTGKWNIVVVVTIHDATHHPLAGATVQFAWSDGVTATCITGADGTCSLKRNNVSAKVASLTLQVVDVTLSGYEYDATANEVAPIVVNKP